MPLTAVLADPWLGDLLGYPAYHLSTVVDLPSPELLPPGPAFVDGKVEVRQIQILRHLENLGFRIIDTNLQLMGQPHISGSDASRCRLAIPEDAAEVVAIAAQSFEVSRFHLDPKISNPVANQIKAAWAKNFFAGRRGDEMVVAEHQGQIAGFMQLLGGQKKSWVIDLLAVAPGFRGQGLARAMIAYGAQHYLTPSMAMKVGTQVANISALKLYTSLGFRVDQATYVLHLHI